MGLLDVFAFSTLLGRLLTIKSIPKASQKRLSVKTASVKTDPNCHRVQSLKNIQNSPSPNPNLTLTLIVSDCCGQATAKR